MLMLEKKKRTHSGSRSKSRKYKANELSVDLRGKPTQTQPAQQTKVKTQNSSSLNKSRPSRKTSTKQQKKHTKSNNKDSKDPASHSVSADRKLSLAQMNKTEANYDNEYLEKRILKLQRTLRDVQRPACININVLQDYFYDIREKFENLEEPLYTFCLELHSLYLLPLKKLFDMVAPYQDLLRKKEEITKLIDQQIIQNDQLFDQLQPLDMEIFKLKEKIEEQKTLIEQKRLLKLQQEKALENSRNVIPEPKMVEIPVKKDRVEHIGKGFKLDLDNIQKEGQLGFHEEFYSKLQQFSQSWRDQALRQKRF